MLEKIASAFDNDLKQAVEKDALEKPSLNEFAANASRFFRQELGLEERDDPNDYRGRQEPRPRTALQLLALLENPRNAEAGIWFSMRGSDVPGRGYIRDEVTYAVRAAREEAERQIEQERARRPKKRSFHSREDREHREADAFAKRVTKAKQKTETQGR